MPRDPQGAGTRTMLDGLPLCSRCGLLAADHLASVTDCAGFVAPTPDAVAQARKALDASFVAALMATFPISGGAAQKHSQCVDALIAAVRAECAAKCVADTKRLDWLDARMVRRPDSWGYNDATNVWSVVANGPRDAGGNLRPEIADVRAAIDHAMQEAQP